MMDPKARFLEISLLMEKHSRGLVFSQAMETFPSALFHEWCDLAKQVKNGNERHFFERLGNGSQEDPFRFVPIAALPVEPGPLHLDSELRWLLNEHWFATDVRECGTQTGYDWFLRELQLLIDKEAKNRILAATRVVKS